MLIYFAAFPFRFLSIIVILVFFLNSLSKCAVVLAFRCKHKRVFSIFCNDSHSLFTLYILFSCLLPSRVISTHLDVFLHIRINPLLSRFFHIRLSSVSKFLTPLFLHFRFLFFLRFLSFFLAFPLLFFPAQHISISRAGLLFPSSYRCIFLLSHIFRKYVLTFIFLFYIIGIPLFFSAFPLALFGCSFHDFASFCYVG